MFQIPSNVVVVVHLFAQQIAIVVSHDNNAKNNNTKRKILRSLNKSQRKKFAYESQFQNRMSAEKKLKTRGKNKDFAMLPPSHGWHTSTKPLDDIPFHSTLPRLLRLIILMCNMTNHSWFSIPRPEAEFWLLLVSDKKVHRGVFPVAFPLYFAVLYFSRLLDLC